MRTFLNRKWQFKPNDIAIQYVFIHIPKTAGTTFRIILYNHFKDKYIYPTRNDLKQNGGGYLLQDEFLKHKEIANKTIFIGHYHVDIASKIGKQVKTLAFFRNPIDRVISTIKHIKKYDKNFYNADIQEIVEKNWHRIVWAQSRNMGYNFKTHKFNSVLQNLKNLDFIGITEYFEESLDLCNATFDWQLENIAPKNVINDDVYAQISGKTMAKISRALIPEIRTYNNALNLFIKRCKAQNIVIDY